MLSNAYFLAKFRFDTAENEPAKNLKIFEKIKNFPKKVCHIPSPRPQVRRHATLRSSSRASSTSPAPTTRPRARSGRRHDGRSAKFRQNVARFRLYRHRFLQENMRFAAFFKIYQILKLKFLKFDKILQILRHLQFFC